MQIGDEYNPVSLFYGVLVPDWLLQRREVSQGAKLCFSLLCRKTGKDGTCKPTLADLVEGLGVSEKQVGNYLRELEKLELITRVRQGQGRANIYVFRWHEWAEKAEKRKTFPSNDRQYIATQIPDDRNDVSTQSPIDRQHTTALDRNYSSTPTLLAQTLREGGREGIAVPAKPAGPPAHLNGNGSHPGYAAEAARIIAENEPIFVHFLGPCLGESDWASIRTQIKELLLAGIPVDADLLEAAGRIARADQDLKRPGRRGFLIPGYFRTALKKAAEERAAQAQATQNGPALPRPVPTKVADFGPWPGWKRGTRESAPEWWIEQCESRIIAAHGKLIEPSRLRVKVAK